MGAVSASASRIIISLRGHGSHQYAGRSVVRFEILLDEKTAQRVADYHRRAGQAVGNYADVLDVISERTGAQRSCSGCSHGRERLPRERDNPCLRRNQKIFVPTPCSMPGAVDEKQRDRMGFADTPLIDYLKHAPRLARLCAQHVIRSESIVTPSPPPPGCSQGAFGQPHQGLAQRAQHDRHAVYRDRYPAVVPTRLIIRPGQL